MASCTVLLVSNLHILLEFRKKLNMMDHEPNSRLISTLFPNVFKYRFRYCQPDVTAQPSQSELGSDPARDDRNPKMASSTDVQASTFGRLQGSWLDGGPRPEQCPLKIPTALFLCILYFGFGLSYTNYEVSGRLSLVKTGADVSPFSVRPLIKQWEAMWRPSLIGGRWLARTACR